MAVELTEVTLIAGNVKLGVYVTPDLKKDNKPFGYISVYDGYLDSEEVFWDNVDYFKNLDDTQRGHIVLELLEKNQFYPDVLKDIDAVVERIKAMRLLW